MWLGGRGKSLERRGHNALTDCSYTLFREAEWFVRARSSGGDGVLHLQLHCLVLYVMSHLQLCFLGCEPLGVVGHGYWCLLVVRTRIQPRYAKPAECAHNLLLPAAHAYDCGRAPTNECVLYVFAGTVFTPCIKPCAYGYRSTQKGYLCTHVGLFPASTHSAAIFFELFCAPACIMG